MKKNVALLLTITILMSIIWFVPALGEEQFSLHGITFGMSKEETKSILDKQYPLNYDEGILLSYNNVPCSKFSDGILMCNFYEDTLVAITSGTEGAYAYTYLRGAMKTKYGEANSNREEFLDRCFSIGFQRILKMTSDESALYWKIGNVLISLREIEPSEYSNGGAYIFYLGEAPDIEYNITGL